MRLVAGEAPGPPGTPHTCSLHLVPHDLVRQAEGTLTAMGQRL